ncbi:MAG: class I SAM-dependent methyltransferase [Sulfurimonadaceae bacterium]|nr:class I SAM-dependent methyltransferase [Sulfurimonadaceae bacterium]
MIGQMWDGKFSRDGYLYGKAPNAFLKPHIDAMQSGSTLLLLGEGEGRNACYAASKGLDVTALDASEVGLQKAQAMADEAGVSITTLLIDLQEWHSDVHYDAVMASFLHLEEPLRTKAFREALKALKPSGVFVAEFFSTKQMPLTSGGPKNLDLLYTVESLQSIFDLEGYKIVQLEETVDLLDEGPGHQGDAQLIRVKVKKL